MFSLVIYSIVLSYCLYGEKAWTQTTSVEHEASNQPAGFYFSNGNGGEWVSSKGYYKLTGGEFSKCEISQNLAYVGTHLVLVNFFWNCP